MAAAILVEHKNAQSAKSTPSHSEIGKALLQRLRQSHLLEKTQFIILFGSVSKGKQTPLSDLDLCVSLDLPPKERLRARVHLLGLLPEHFDLQVFEDLPLYLKKSVLSGTLLYCKDKQQLVQRALNVIEEYEDFEPVYSAYIAGRRTKAGKVQHGQENC